MCQEFNKYWIKYQKSADEMVKEFVDWQENKLKENNMEDRNKTVAELIADLQNKLDRATNRIEGLVKENDELKERNNTQIAKLKTVINSVYGLNAFKDIRNVDTDTATNYEYYKKLKNENEYLEKEIAKWRSKYTKEKTKHDKATKKIDELKKHQKDELVWSNIRRHDNIDSLLYSYWGLKEYYQEAKCNKNEANDVKE